MVIPPKTLSRLGMQGYLEMPEAIEAGYNEGYIIGENDTKEFFYRTLEREIVLCNSYFLDSDVDDEFIRGCRQTLDNLKNKFNSKYA